MAVLLVLLYHTGIGIPGGFVGVDVFFVISGYLITQILLRELSSTDTIVLTRFWRRRICRIAPAAMTTILVVVMVTACISSSVEDVSDTLQAAFFQPFCVSNIYFWLTTDYFSRPAELRPLLHTWSLAVEEQFYLFYPLLIILMRKWPLQLQCVFLVILGMSSLALSEAALWYYPTASFFLMPCRIWELLIGAVLAYQSCVVAIRGFILEVFSATGLCLIAWSAFSLSNQSLFPGVQALAPCLGAVLFIAANSGRLSSTGHLLAAKPLVAIGLISYSLYLLHWPILVALRHVCEGGPSTGVKCIGLIAAVALSIASWKYIEQPARAAGASWSFRKAVSYYCAGTACLLIVTASVHFISANIAYEPLRAITRLSGQVQSTAEDLNLPPRGKMIGVNTRDQQVEFALWGDSHAESIHGLCDQLAKEFGLRGVSVTWPGFVPILDAWHVDPTIEGPAKQMEWNRKVVHWIVENEVREILVVARWELRFGALGLNHDEALLRDAKTVDVSAVDSERVAVEQFRQTLQVLRKAHCRVWLLSQVPVQDQSKVTSTIQVDVHPDRMPTGVSRARYTLQQKPFERVFGQFEGVDVKIIRPSDEWFDQASLSRIFLPNRRLYHDDNHLSVDGTKVLIRPLLSDVFSSISESIRTRDSSQ